MIALLGRYKLAAEIVAALALLALLLWGFNRFCESKREEGRVEVQALWDKQKITDAETYRLRTEANQLIANTAITQGAQREQTIKALAASSSAAAASMRDTLAAISTNIPTATVEALRNTTATLNTVFGDCTARYRAVAENADRHASDAKTLSEAWPTK